MTIEAKVPFIKAVHAQISSYHSQHAVPTGMFMKIMIFVDTVMSVRTICARGAQSIAGSTNGFDKRVCFKFVSGILDNLSESFDFFLPSETKITNNFCFGRVNVRVENM